MKKKGSDNLEVTSRIWCYIDERSEDMQWNGALYVLYATLDKLGNFRRKGGITKDVMAEGRIRSFIVPHRKRSQVLNALNAHNSLLASLDYKEIVEFRVLCRHVTKATSRARARI